MNTYALTPMIYLFSYTTDIFTAPREVVALIPGRDRPKCLKLVVVAFPFGPPDYGNSTQAFVL